MATRTRTDFYSGKIIKNVRSFDRSSSYPDVQCNCPFPMTKFKVSRETLEHELKAEKAILARISMTNVRLTNWKWGCPYLTKDKSRKIVNGEFDNGRILSADYLEVTVTDIDIRILMKEYEADDIHVIEMYTAVYRMLPEELRNVDLEYYKRKTELKDVEGQEVYYIKSKNKLNSVYGMSAQNPVKQDIVYNTDTLDFSVAEEDEQKILLEYQKNAFLSYAWGVWTTAWARYRLHEGLWIVGDRFVYCDTDSVKYIDGKVSWEELNERLKEESIKHGAYATDKHGITHYMGVYEDEGVYEQFKTLGAKKYAYVKNGKLTVTVSGVNKKKGGVELGKIENFKEGFIFKEAGGTESIYNDIPDVDYLEFEGKKVKITSNVAIVDSTYKLGITGEYERLLKNLPMI